jgi:hypothetical protein
VPYLAGKVLIIFNFLRLDDGLVKIGDLLDGLGPGWVNIIPDSFWLALPEKIINVAFVSPLLLRKALLIYISPTSYKFTFIIPKIFDIIDKAGHAHAERTVAMKND